MFVLGIGPGPEVGILLREIRDAQEDGSIADRDAALRYLVARGKR